MVRDKPKTAAQERAERHAEIAEAFEDAKQAKADIEFGQTPMGREAADKLLGL